jgi:outer membrane biosynthesis protein TonB
MKAPLKSVAWLLPLVLAGCSHKNQQALNQPLAPPIVDTAPPPPQPTTVELPPPVMTEPQPQTQPEPTPPPKTESKPTRHVARHPKTDAAKTTEQASNASGASAVSAIGQLSPGDSGDLRSQTEQSIASIDQELKKITRPLNDQEQKTAGQIREFLKQARAALLSGDVDGAYTLAVKARVLLGELTK